jgi:hypothetical protein
MLSQLHRLRSRYGLRDLLLLGGLSLLSAVVGVWVNLPEQTLAALLADWRWIAGTSAGYAATFVLIIVLCESRVGEIILSIIFLVILVPFLAVILWTGWMLPRLLTEAPLWAAVLIVTIKVGAAIAVTWHIVTTVLYLRSIIRERSSAAPGQ